MESVLLQLLVVLFAFKPATGESCSSLVIRISYLYLACMLSPSSFLTHPPLLRAATEVVRSHTCSFEPPGGSCDWSMPRPNSGGLLGITSASNGPSLGPTADVNPGTHEGT